MLKINKNLSVLLSAILSWVVLGGIIALAVILPVLTYFFLHSAHPQLLEFHYTGILVTLYLALVPALGAVTALLRLLSLVRKECVFTPSAVSCLRLISWCCFAETVIFAVFTMYFTLSVLLAFAALFMGLILRVVKNVIEEAAAIKSENDLTV